MFTHSSLEIINHYFLISFRESSIDIWIYPSLLSCAETHTHTHAYIYIYISRPRSSSPFLATMSELSAYEQQREERIRRNQEFLAELGLGSVSKIAPKKRKAVPVKRKAKRANLSTSTLRRSSRVKEAECARKKNRESVKADGKQSDEEFSIQSGDDDSEYEEEFVIKRPRKHKKRTMCKLDAITDSFLACELAKTGRSSCRKCREKIPKDATRIGMKAWIAGRNAMTWQHPACFLSLVEFTRETSGRTKCKVSKTYFQKDELRVTFHSHSAASHVRLDELAAALEPLMKSSARKMIDPLTFQNIAILDPNEMKHLKKIASVSFAHEHSQSEKPKSNKRTKVLPVKMESLNQPPQGEKTKTKGNVAWKWGNYECFLIPSKETPTHCYARTHKNNVKTLAKGKSYWRIVLELMNA